MKINSDIMKNSLFALAAVCMLTLGSCHKEDEGVHISGVWTNQLDTESQQITQSYTGLWVRLEGSGFSGLKGILCNGQSADFNPVYVTDNHIIFKIPDSVPLANEVDESIANTIQVISEHGRGIYNGFLFKDKSRMPSIKSVSYTMPLPGDVITVTGSNLLQVDEIWFPSASGEVQATDYTLVSNSKLTVTVPASAGGKSGAIRVGSTGDSSFSPAYMFYREGVFLHDFTEVQTGANNNATVISDPDAIALLTGLTRNPEYVLAIPSVAADFAVASSNSVGSSASTPFFRFLAGKGLQNVIDNVTGENDITGATELLNLAIQFDVYMPRPWTSGAVVLKMNKDMGTTDGSRVKCLTPTYKGGAYTFGGWETFTVNFNDFKTLSLGTLEAYITSTISPTTQAFLAFCNYNVNGDYTPSALTGFQFFVANVRLVPTTVPTE
jgi:hypothetical protein